MEDKRIKDSIQELDSKMEIFRGLSEDIEMDYRKVREGYTMRPLFRLKSNLIKVNKMIKMLRKDFREYKALVKEVKGK